IPELQLGIIVFTNQQSGSAFNAITNTIKDSYMGIRSEDYVTIYNNRLKANVQSADKITDEVWKTVAKNEASGKKIDFSKITGTYNDKWFGNITISVVNGQLYFA